MKKRLLFYTISKYLEHKNALVITGMRQVGKTTLMRQLYAQLPTDSPKAWFDFDNPFDTKPFEDNEYRNIYQRLQQITNAKKTQRLYIFIDEIQRFPEITRIIKFLIDHYRVKFIVTGSSNFYLKNLFPESLSGRKFLYDLPPLSFREYLYFHDKISREEASPTIQHVLQPMDNIRLKQWEVEYEEYLLFGGFPEVVVTEQRETKKEILKNIFTSFFEKDVSILSDHADIRELRDLLLLLVPRVGSMMDVSKIANALGVARPKVYQYLQFLQGTFVIRTLPKYSKSVDRSVAGGRKVYFSDTGLLQAIGAVNEAQVLENAVINQLSSYGPLSFYNKRNTAEIDCIINNEIACEIKMNGSTADYQKLSSLAKILGLKKQYIISKKIIEEPWCIPALQL